MYLVQKNHIRWKTLAEYKILLRLARLSKNVYNTALWYINDHYDKHKTYLRYEELYKIMKGQDPNYL
ncbi:MAG: hypothetical protein HeimC3_07950 [Candidatus Heimdallarchaeota archaeon LC_3]|nr:MAG: hypothetical protein HeimC3_07950 [Candidatus Heimdallarchaeota archaeon LC_3]